VDDFLGQVGDYFAILDGVEQAIAEDGTNAIEWRIVGATKNSPIELEARAFPTVYAVNIDRRVELVTRQTAFGLQQLRTRRERPSYFTDKVLARAEKFFDRVTNGLDTTVVDFGDELPKLELTPVVASEAAANAPLAPEELRRRQFAALTAWVLAGAWAQALVLAVEDAHWADPTTLDLLRGIAERGALAPLFLAITVRPELRVRARVTPRFRSLRSTAITLSTTMMRITVGCCAVALPIVVGIVNRWWGQSLRCGPT
jgi:hypothetical protein